MAWLAETLAEDNVELEGQLHETRAAHAELCAAGKLLAAAESTIHSCNLGSLDTPDQEVGLCQSLGEERGLEAGKKREEWGHRKEERGGPRPWLGWAWSGLSCPAPARSCGLREAAALQVLGYRCTADDDAVKLLLALPFLCNCSWPAYRWS
jgi:hypothetical protein